ncbi:hypothetical protein BKA93DRAFT_170887 [Sparassis latifolia]
MRCEITEGNSDCPFPVCGTDQRHQPPTGRAPSQLRRPATLCVYAQRRAPGWPSGVQISNTYSGFEIDDGRQSARRRWGIFRKCSQRTLRSSEQHVKYLRLKIARLKGTLTAVSGAQLVPYPGWMVNALLATIVRFTIDHDASYNYGSLRKDSTRGPPKRSNKR